MRSLAVLTSVLAGFLAGPVLAATKTTVKIETYAISGDSGAALVDAMDRRGPRHGLLARALAQTRYSVKWQLDWSKDKGVCRLKKAQAALSITYRYPSVAKPLPPALQRRWNRFMAGVRTHEQTHGRIANQMVAAARRSVAQVAAGRTRDCLASKIEVSRRVKAIYADYEARQIAFDAREHRDGGKVEALVRALVGQK